MREWRSKISQILRGRRALDDDLSEELRSHLDFLIEENVARGVPPEEARARARRRLGNDMTLRERACETWKFPRTETILQDLRYCLRCIRKSPSFSLVVILTMALGVGANTAIFSVVYAVLLRPLPYPAGERLVWLGEATPKATGISVTWINFQHWRNENRSFEDLAGFENADLTMTARGEAVLTHAAVVTSSFFHLTGWQPLLGRLFTESDDQRGAAPTVVVSGEFWERTLGGNPNVLGTTLTLNGKAYQIIGVLRPGLRFFSTPVDYFLPLGLSSGNTADRSQHASMRVLGLLKPGLTLAVSQADLNAIMQRLALTDPGPEDDHRAFAEYLSEKNTGDVRPTLFMLMGAVGLVLMLACANVASLLMVRSTGRVQEIAIRAAIGAGRARLVRQMLTENLVTAALGGGLGLLLGEFGLRMLVLAGPTDIPRFSEATLDIHVLVFGAVITMVVGMLAGIAPVLTIGKVDLTLALKEGSPRSGGGRQGHSVRSGLVIAEIAITVMLLFTSGLLLRSLIAAQTVYPGFDPDRLLALELQLPPSRYESAETIHLFYDRLMQDLRREPGVDAVGAVNCPPSAGDCGDYWYSILEMPAPARGDVPISLFNIADTAYFQTMDMPLLAGRGFADADRKSGSRIVVINRTIARKWWATPQLALGHHVKIGGPYMEGPTCEIVGVVESVRQMGLDSVPMPEVYSAFSQHADQAMVVMIRTTADPAPLIPAVRRHVATIDRNVPIQSLRPFEEWLGATLEQRRFSTLLLGVFAALAMILAAVGIYGLLNFWVSVRQKEIAIRLALGARRSAILRWIGSHAIRLVLFGTTLGAGGSWAASRWLKNFVFGVSAQNPAMMLAAGAAVIGIAALATSVPLLRATRVDAVRNLHDA